MRLHGVALAVTGQEPELIDLICTSTYIESDKPKQVIRRPEHTFDLKVHLGYEDSVLKAFEPVVNAVRSAVDAQLLHSDNKSNCPVSIVCGTDGRQEYDINSMLSNLVNKTNPSEKKLKLSDLYGDMSDALKFCFLSWGQYGHIHDIPVNKKYEITSLSEIDTKINEDILKIGYLSAPSSENLSKLCELARSYAIYFYSSLLSSPNTNIEKIKELSFISEGRMCNDYKENEEVRKKYPLYSFTTWHPDIYEAFTDKLSKLCGIKGNLYFKSPTEAPSRFYEDIVTTMLWDQVDVLSGKRKKDDIAYKDSSKWREHIIQSFSDHEKRLVHLKR